MRSRWEKNCESRLKNGIVSISCIVLCVCIGGEHETRAVEPTPPTTSTAILPHEHGVLRTLARTYTHTRGRGRSTTTTPYRWGAHRRTQTLEPAVGRTNGVLLRGREDAEGTAVCRIRWFFITITYTYVHFACVLNAHDSNRPRASFLLTLLSPSISCLFVLSPMYLYV